MDASKFYEPLKLSPKLKIFQTIASIPDLENPKSLLKGFFEDRVMNESQLKKYLLGEKTFFEA